MARPLKPLECAHAKRLRAMDLNKTEVGAILGRDTKTVRELEKRGFTPTDFGRGRRRARPTDFAEVYAIRTVAETAVYFRTGRTTVTRWADELGIRRNPSAGQRRRKPRDGRPVPDDFAERYARDGFRACVRHYRCGTGTVSKWLAKSGTLRKNPPPAEPAVLAVPEPSGLPVIRSRILEAQNDHHAAPSWAMKPPAGYAAYRQKLPPVPTIDHGRAA